MKKILLIESNDNLRTETSVFLENSGYDVISLTDGAVGVQKALQELQPKISEIQKKNKDDKEAQAKAMMELYQKEKINPLSGCLPLLLQLPILIALYQVFCKGLKPEALVDLYSFVHNPGVIDASFIGIINLGEASIFFALLAGVAQFYQTKMIAPKKSKKKTGQFAEMMQKQMLYFSPVFMTIILLKLPAALALYLIITSVFTIFQQKLIMKENYAK